MAPERKSVVAPKREVALGMTNLGSTCYMNAVLQALAHAPELCMAMDCEPHHATCVIAKENAEKLRLSPKSSPDGSAERKTIMPSTRKSRRSGKRSPTAGSSDGEDGLELKFCALCEVERHLGRVHVSPGGTPSTSRTEADAIAPHDFVNGFISQVAPWFKLGVQEDSHEFLRLLIDAMQKSCARARKDSNGDDSSDSNEEQQSKESTMNESADDDSSQVKSTDADVEYPFKLFRGTVKSNVTCDSCGTTSSKIDPIEDIGLEVTSRATDSKGSMRSKPPPSSAALADVSQAFQRFARAEQLDSGYKCDNCGKVGRATKQSRLAAIPPILTLHLKRFRYGSEKSGSGTNHNTQLPRRTGRSELSQLLGPHAADFYGGGSGSAKIEGHIKFDEILDLRPYLTPELQQESKKMLCRLFAVVVHAGKNSHSGHYVAYVRNVLKNEWWKMDDARVTRATLHEVLQAEAYMLFYRVVNHPVSIKLEQDLKVKEEAAAKQAEMKAAVSVQKEKAKTDDLSRKSGSKRKREPPEFPDPAEWARTQTRDPASLIPYINQAEDIISENVQFTSEYFKLIREEAERAGKVGCGPSGVGADDMADGTADKVRRRIINFFHGLVENKGGDPFLPKDPKIKKGSGSLLHRVKESSLIVPVLDANDNFL